jgi:Ser/Thr protein kinase RdoA (MazF antagonist)
MLGPDIETLARGRGVALAESEAISTHGAARPARETFRLRFADGTTLKGRRLASADVARRVEAIVARLDPRRFTRVVARHGAALLEEWIDGEPLDRRPPDASHLAWAGATLGTVHAAPPPDLPGESVAADERLAADLARLVDAGALAEADAARLRTRAGAAPPAADVTIVHRDLCPENIVVARDGRLVAVDNAAARVGWADEDLARTFYRWPLEAGEGDAFLAAYAAHRDPAAFLAHRAFWMVTALAHAACVRTNRGYAEADATVRRLRDEC